MSSSLKKTLLASHKIQKLIYLLIRLYAWTFRLKVINEKPWMAHLKNGGRVLLCTWHQQFFSAIRYFKTYSPLKPALMISQSLDGELIASVATQTGWHIKRGSSSRGGKAALQVMIRHLREHGLAAHIMDGPRGPLGYVKPGAIQLALNADAVIVPFYTVADRAWYFRSWDRFFIPKPFARVSILYGDPIHLNQPVNEKDFEPLRQKVETIMQRELQW